MTLVEEGAHAQVRDGYAIPIREATPQEYPRVAEVLVESFTAAFDVSDMYIADLRDVAGHAKAFRIWVALDDQEIVGAVLTPKDPLHIEESLEYVERWERDFRMLAVSPAARGKGVGRSLIDHAVRELGALGVRRVAINTGLRMKAARKLYESYGFVRRPERETMVVDGGYRVLSYTFDIPESLQAEVPRFDAIEAQRTVSPQPEGQGSIPGFLKALGLRLKQTTILTDSASLAEAQHDRSSYEEEESALAVIRPETIEEVSTAVATANEYRIPVFVRGAGTGLAGGAIPTRSGLVIATSSLNTLYPVDVTDRSVRVQAGVITAEISKLAAREGLFYAPDPASADISSIGGNIATNAGGFHCVKYGVTRDSVLSLTAVLADGSIITTGSGTVKDVAGLDLTSLLTGSEGVLAVVVEAVLRLRPLPEQSHALICLFPDLIESGRAAQRISSARVQPSVFELMAVPPGIGRNARFADAARGNSWMLIIESDEDTPVTASRIEEAIQPYRHATIHPDEEELRWAFSLRKRGKPYPENVWMAGGDTAVPPSGLVDMLVSLEEIAHRHGLGYSLVAHVGDGNLHTAFFTGRHTTDTAYPRALEQARRELIERSLELGGTITGEHGVGVDLKDYLGSQIGGRQLELQRAIKRAMDPNGILNPGKWL